MIPLGCCFRAAILFLETGSRACNEGVFWSPAFPLGVFSFFAQLLVSVVWRIWSVENSTGLLQYFGRMSCKKKSSNWQRKIKAWNRRAEDEDLSYNTWIRCLMQLVAFGFGKVLPLFLLVLQRLTDKSVLQSEAMEETRYVRAGIQGAERERNALCHAGRTWGS